MARSFIDEAKVIVFCCVRDGTLGTRLYFLHTFELGVHCNLFIRCALVWSNVRVDGEQDFGVVAGRWRPYFRYVGRNLMTFLFWCCDDCVLVNDFSVIVAWLDCHYCGELDFRCCGMIELPLWLDLITTVAWLDCHCCGKDCQVICYKILTRRWVELLFYRTADQITRLSGQLRTSGLIRLPIWLEWIVLLWRDWTELDCHGRLIGMPLWLDFIAIMNSWITTMAWLECHCGLLDSYYGLIGLRLWIDRIVIVAWLDCYCILIELLLWHEWIAFVVWLHWYCGLIGLL